jgi:hypothetical protein
MWTAFGPQAAGWVQSGSVQRSLLLALATFSRYHELLRIGDSIGAQLVAMTVRLYCMIAFPSSPE